MGKEDVSIEFPEKMRSAASIWLAEELDKYTEKYSPDGGHTIPHLKILGDLRQYTNKRFFSRARVERGLDYPTEVFIAFQMMREPLDDALVCLNSIYKGLIQMIPKSMSSDEYL